MYDTIQVTSCTEHYCWIIFEHKPCGSRLAKKINFYVFYTVVYLELFKMRLTWNECGWTTNSFIAGKLSEMRVIPAQCGWVHIYACNINLCTFSCTDSFISFQTMLYFASRFWHFSIRANLNSSKTSWILQLLKKYLYFNFYFFALIININGEAYSGPCETTKMELFAKSSSQKVPS